MIKTLAWTDDVRADTEYWQQNDEKILKRINVLVQDVVKRPFEGIGKPEPLQGSLGGCWSRRIDNQHRLVYRVEGSRAVVLSCRYHY